MRKVLGCLEKNIRKKSVKVSTCNDMKRDNYDNYCVIRCERITRPYEMNQC